MYVVVFEGFDGGMCVVMCYLYVGCEVVVWLCV